MIEIKDLLLKFNEILVSGEIKKEFIKKSINSILGIEINNDDIKIKNNTVYLNIKPLYKNEILIKKELITAKLEEFFGKKSPSDIR